MNMGGGYGDTGCMEIAPGSARKACSTDTRSEMQDGFDPLATMPADLPESQQAVYRRLAKRPGFRSAVKLKCVECCGWSRLEAGRCGIRSCALWRSNQAIFRGRS